MFGFVFSCKKLILYVVKRRSYQTLRARTDVQFAPVSLVMRLTVNEMDWLCMQLLIFKIIHKQWSYYFTLRLQLQIIHYPLLGQLIETSNTARGKYLQDIIPLSSVKHTSTSHNLTQLLPVSVVWCLTKNWDSDSESSRYKSKTALFCVRKVGYLVNCIQMKLLSVLPGRFYAL